MDRRYLFFNSGLGFWSLALVASFYSFRWTWLFGLLAVASFLFYVLQWKVAIMFKKPGKSTDIAAEKKSASSATAVEKNRPPSEEKVSNTVIARDVCFKGNITAAGQVYVYGEIEGNISASDALVKVMRGGRVQGDISCHELLIDGNIQGECKAESIEIGEHAHVHGTLNYAVLAVKKGGVFIGHAEATRQPEHAANVIGIAPASAVAGKALPKTLEKSQLGHA
ncbi:Ccm protein [Mixta gaviniae]|uniref:Ccm protein n=2 Tax=Mixta gaviniae TaxID=665914 RepID=A0A1X1E5Y6_9GAMM|nr:Ccm protein [Mixta gaviniae]ORM84346.1 hypothetical protein HA44_05125 [Mixta gaviniae]